MSEDPRLRRLRVDYEKLYDLDANSDIFSFKVLEGTPPERYLFAFSCRGVAGIDGRGSATYADRHEVEVYLHERYPVIPPQVVWCIQRTPVWHPNINHRNGQVCIGVWTANKFLDDLAHQIYDMVRYANFNERDPLDHDPVEWVARNKNLFPLDTRQFRTAPVDVKIAGEPTAEEIEIKLGETVTQRPPDQQGASDEIEIKLGDAETEGEAVVRIGIDEDVAVRIL